MVATGRTRLVTGAPLDQHRGVLTSGRQSVLRSIWVCRLTIQLQRRMLAMSSARFDHRPDTGSATVGTRKASAVRDAPALEQRFREKDRSLGSPPPACRHGYPSHGLGSRCECPAGPGAGPVGRAAHRPLSSGSTGRNTLVRRSIVSGRGDRDAITRCVVDGRGAGGSGFGWAVGGCRSAWHFPAGR